MNEKRLLIIVAILSTLCAFMLRINGVSAPPASPYIKVLPTTTTIGSFIENDRTYTISVYTDYAGDDVYLWDVQLSFSPEVLECTSVLNGDLITTAKDPSARFMSAFNNAAGKASAGAYFYYPPLEPPPFTTSGPGTLVYFTFRVIGAGTSELTLDEETKLQRFNFDTGEPENIINGVIDLDHLGHGIVTVTVFDLNDNNKIDAADLWEMGKAYGSTAGPPPSSNWNAECDFNSDDIINTTDLSDVANSYGHSW